MPVRTEETHRPTLLEIFFDLVFIFAVTRVILLMGSPPTASAMAHGLLLLMLLWISWSNYTWLANQVRADVGVIRVGTTLAMAALFVAALVIPDAWRHDGEGLDTPLTLALAYVALTALHLLLYFYSAADDRRLRVTLGLFAAATVLTWVPLIIGAVLGGAAQTSLWAAAFLLTFVGGFLASSVSGWRLRSASHFAERHSLVMIIAFGESLISVGAGTGRALTRAPLLVAALLAFIITISLWWLYFGQVAGAAGRALAGQPHERRSRLATNAYSLAHFPLLAGVIYLALGVEQVFVQMAHQQPGRAIGALPWLAAVSLDGGAALYLAGRALFLWLAVGTVPLGQLVAAGLAVLLLPAAPHLSALAGLGALTALLVVLTGYERNARPPLPT